MANQSKKRPQENLTACFLERRARALPDGAPAVNLEITTMIFCMLALFQHFLTFNLSISWTFHFGTERY